MIDDTMKLGRRNMWLGVKSDVEKRVVPLLSGWWCYYHCCRTI